MLRSENGYELRQQILQLLQAQMHALEEPSRLSDVQLAACYRRQQKVSELRDQLSIALKLQEAPKPERSDLCSAPVHSVTNRSPAVHAAVEAAV